MLRGPKQVLPFVISCLKKNDLKKKHDSILDFGSTSLEIILDGLQERIRAKEVKKTGMYQTLRSTKAEGPQGDIEE
ncbi:unnamed protein product [Pieris brassicae]|uniref:Uncharacterized protein n=1 Tax=Pieris brassicae TaxID=7116 RepID=A0A9P0X9A7_PIEBR|nr:unnamed protein product [Pieris brassicae]